MPPATRTASAGSIKAAEWRALARGQERQLARGRRRRIGGERNRGRAEIVRPGRPRLPALRDRETSRARRSDLFPRRAGAGRARRDCRARPAAASQANSKPLPKSVLGPPPTNGHANGARIGCAPAARALERTSGEGPWRRSSARAGGAIISPGRRKATTYSDGRRATARGRTRWT